MARRTVIQRDVARTLRATVAAGIEVLRIEIDKTGKITIVTGNKRPKTLDDELDQELAEWDARNKWYVCSEFTSAFRGIVLKKSFWGGDQIFQDR